jgi:hypothetical protein
MMVVPELPRDEAPVVVLQEQRPVSPDVIVEQQPANLLTPVHFAHHSASFSAPSCSAPSPKRPRRTLDDVIEMMTSDTQF